MDKTIGIVGLGRVGMPAAKAYVEASYQVFGYDPNPNAVAEFKAIGGRAGSNPADVARKAEVVLVMVLNDAQVIEAVAKENGIIQGAKPGSTIICMSTINRSNLEKVAAECAAKGLDFVDCPFTGGPARIPTGSLTLIAAANPRVLALVTPVLEVIGNIIHAGDRPGLGQAIKHCNQLLVGATHAATMEVIVLARKLGLNPALVTQVVGSGIAGSDYFRLLAESVLEKKPSPGGLGQMCKDVAIVANTTRDVNLPAYVANAAARYFSMAEALGMQDREGADLIEIVEGESRNVENQDLNA